MEKSGEENLRACLSCTKEVNGEMASPNQITGDIPEPIKTKYIRRENGRVLRADVTHSMNVSQTVIRKISKNIQFTPESSSNRDEDDKI